MAESNWSRRDFLNQAAAFASTLAAAKLSMAQQQKEQAKEGNWRTRGQPRERKVATRPATTQASKYSDINVACIGIGGRGKDDLEGVAKPGANIVALCDIDADVLGRTAANFSGAKTYSDFRD